MTFRCMLATDADLEKLRFPILCSPKLDGVRAVVRDGVVYSRSNKPIPNTWVQGKLSHLEHFDGELIVGEPTSKTVYRDTVSHVMAHDKVGFDLRFYVFDHVQEPLLEYTGRAKKIKGVGTTIIKLDQRLVTDIDGLLTYEEMCLDNGYEGLILRSPDAPYKMGRSTVKEGYLLKLKRMQTDEAVIVGFEERMHNANVATTNELGRTKRSSHKANKHGRGDLGALVLRMTDGTEFSCGTGFSDAERQHIWDNQAKYLGKMVSFDHFPIGVKDKPRHPSYKGLRDQNDL